MNSRSKTWRCSPHVFCETSSYAGRTCSFPNIVNTIRYVMRSSCNSDTWLTRMTWRCPRNSRSFTRYICRRWRNGRPLRRRQRTSYRASTTTGYIKRKNHAFVFRVHFSFPNFLYKDWEMSHSFEQPLGKAFNLTVECSSVCTETCLLNYIDNCCSVTQTQDIHVFYLADASQIPMFLHIAARIWGQHWHT